MKQKDESSRHNEGRSLNWLDNQIFLKKLCLGYSRDFRTEEFN